MNRHGLIAGATGTGKTKTLQLISEGLSDASMDVLTPAEIDSLAANSKRVAKYKDTIDSLSAYEILTAKLEEADKKGQNGGGSQTGGNSSGGVHEKSTVEKILESPAARQVGRMAASMITRSLPGALGLGGKSNKKTSWF